ncbi:fungal-specific transcription factor domain-containing protein [Hypomontagnella monticulosa]|nr:fungal-specific transcription factor domain-containing protein [Hypomontagnella monticulosa]
MANHFRQHPGLACEECRRRKARCDRSRPCCGNCNDTGKQCIFNDQRAQRGPKKGQIRALRDRVNTLERLLSEQQHVEESFITAIDPIMTQQIIESPGIATTEISPIWDFEASYPTTVEPLLAEIREPASQASLTPESNMKVFQHSDESCISALMRDDAVSVYFDRVHPNIPIIHKQRYFDMVEQQNPSRSQLCLQLAVQATAAASTAQMLESSDSLYAETFATLEAVEINEPISRTGGAPVELEYIQALLLMVYYEVMRMPQYKCILTSGRAFRLIQISRLHEIDMEAVPIEDISGEVFAREEERRRTFWLAYCFDRFLSIRHGLPHTLHEQATQTRLPAPETSFQASHSVRMPFLSEAISNPGTTILPVFAECVILSTLQGRYVNLRGISPTNAVDFCNKHQEIRDCLQKRIQTITKHLPVTTAIADSHLGLTHILACSVMIDLNELAECMAFEMDEHQKSATICLEQAFAACNEIVRLAKSSSRLGRFKTHIFLPILLSRAIGFLVSHDPHAQPEGVNELMTILQSLSCVNQQARELINELGGIPG